jgi:hypothetical protein
MKITRKLAVLMPVLLSLFMADCVSDNPINCDFAICTEEFRMIMILVKHQGDNSPFLLTSYKVTRVSDNSDITIPDDNLSDNDGVYPVTNDSKRANYKDKNVVVEFKGYINDLVVLQKRLTITADCCHISLVDGETSFYI